MARLLHGEALWSELEQLARRSRRLVAAVGFVGRRPDRLLRWPRGSVLIADLSEVRVREGSSSARGALRLLRKGVEVLSLPGLHAKVFLFDRHAVVGSMNLSEDSRGRLEEAGVLLRRPQELQAVRAYVWNGSGGRRDPRTWILCASSRSWSRAAGRFPPRRGGRAGGVACWSQTGGCGSFRQS